MRTFKFLQLHKPKKSIGLVELKQEFNRNEHLIFIWSEYPYNCDENNIIEFNGNILQFYNLTKRSSPTIYEMHIKETGYFNQSIVFNTRHRINRFIRRKAKLKILYTIN
jgi:hypothetical protein